ncbi:MAG: hypothetical protein VYD01_09045, partial [Pseudomonadota bacterium]|nr:hypothetical protein [Pseudomonadota bacterium]
FPFHKPAHSPVSRCSCRSTDTTRIRPFPDTSHLLERLGTRTSSREIGLRRRVELVDIRQAIT